MNPRQPALSALGAWAAALAPALLLSRRAYAAPEAKLLVFLHAALKQRAFQSELQAALSPIGVTAVGRVADFERARDDAQDAVLTLPLVLAAHGMSSSLQGYRNGSPGETYSLVGVDTPPSPSRITTVGALDLLGREGMTVFVHRLIGVKAKVERVTKFEDLLPLLQMSRADAILLPQRLLPEIRAASRLKLEERPLSEAVGLPALASVGPKAPEVVAALKKLPARLSAALGVDQWR